MSYFNEENNFKSKSNNDFEKQNESKTKEGFDNYKHCLPSFLFDDYFQDKTSEDSEDKEDDIKKNNSFNNIKEGNNIFSDLKKENSSNSNGKIEKNIYDKQMKLNSFNYGYNNNSYINKIEKNQLNNSNQNSINIGKNIFPKSFDYRNNSSYYYQNYLNSINNTQQKGHYFNIMNNINNNFMNTKNSSFTNYVQNRSVNSININNNYMNNYMNNFAYKGEIKRFNSNIPINIQNNKKNQLNEYNYDIAIKKLLNMTDYALYNYLITQRGSRETQKLLSKFKEIEIDILIDKLKQFITEITLDKYGNFFTHKLFKICVPSQRMKLITSLKEHFIEISINSYGTHSLQCLMEIIETAEEKKLILNYIIGNESILSFDSKGTHILQKFISNTKDEERKELNINIVNLIDKLILDVSGVCVLIKLIKHTKDELILQKIAKYITDNQPLFFIQHPYANYAVQRLIINSNAYSYINKIIEIIIDNYLSLSLQKYSSNVVENSIKYGDCTCAKKIFNNIIEQDKLETLLNNNYGNYVIERLLERLNTEDKNKLSKKIEKIGKNKGLSIDLKLNI